MLERISVWEDEGGSLNETSEKGMSGTANQIEWAKQIKTQVNAEFDRVKTALEPAPSSGEVNESRARFGEDAELREARPSFHSKEILGVLFQLWPSCLAAQRGRRQDRRKETHGRRSVRQFRANVLSPGPSRAPASRHRLSILLSGAECGAGQRIGNPGEYSYAESLFIEDQWKGGGSLAYVSQLREKEDLRK